MIASSDLRGYLRAEPFRPFQIRMTSGRMFDIRHPEMIKIGRSSIVIFTLVSDDPEVYDHWDTVSMLLIESVTFLDMAVNSGQSAQG